MVEQHTPESHDAPPEPVAAPPSPARRRRLLPWLWLLVPAMAMASLAAELSIEAGVPTEAEWSTAALAVQGQLRPGDVIWVNPTWAAPPWSELEAAGLAAGLTRGNIFLHASPLTTADVARHARVIIVGREPSELPAVLGAPETIATAGPVTVAVAPVLARVTTDFVAALPEASVARHDAGGRASPCRFSGDRHRCDNRSWTAVRETVSEVGDTRRRCIFAYAFPDRGVLRVRYPDARMGARLTGGVGLRLWAVRQDEGSPVDFRVKVDGEQVYETTMPRGDFSWHELDVDTSSRAGSTAEVVFEVSAEHTYWRQICFDAVAFDVP